MISMIKTPCLNRDDKNSINGMMSLNHDAYDKDSNNEFKS